MDTFDPFYPQQGDEPAPLDPELSQEPAYPPRPQPPVYAMPAQEAAAYTPPAQEAPAYEPPAAGEAPAQPAYQAPQSQPYRMAKPWRESPYANSPYEMHAAPQEPRYIPQVEPPREKPPRKKSRFWSRAITVVLVIALVSVFSGVALSLNSSLLQSQAQIRALNGRITELEGQLQQTQEPVSPGSSSPAPTPAPGDTMTPAQVYQQNVDSVVAVMVTYQETIFGQTTEGTSSGSGFILTEDGYVVTNYHVIEDGTKITVVMHDETELEAKVVGVDSANDLAVLKVEATGLPAASLGSSNALAVGDMVVAIGNPLGELNATQTVGYICGKEREVTTGGTIISMLQTDAAINPGNSGGPLFNMQGQVVGITTAKYSGTTSSGASIEGIGFAIPIDDVAGIISDLKTFGYVTGAYLGVTVQNLTPEVTESTGIRGARIVGIEPGYAADRAGLRENDIITALNGKAITSITDLTLGLRNFKAGDTVTLTVIRGGLQLDVDVTLDEKPQQMPIPTQPESEMPSEGDYEEWYDYFHPEN